MTEDQLAEIEARAQAAMHRIVGSPVPALCVALREAWAERDRIVVRVREVSRHCAKCAGRGVIPRRILLSTYTLDDDKSRVYDYRWEDKPCPACGVLRAALAALEGEGGK